MRDVLIALVPALIASVWVFGFSALLRVIVCVIFAVGSEYLFEKACGRPDYHQRLFRRRYRRAAGL